jgi:hypothetical protein
MSLLALVLASSAWAAFQALPVSGGQVNNDPANGIDPKQDAGRSDVVGGSLASGAVRVPWAAFEQKSSGAQEIFVRAFKAGAWVTEGSPASLNIDPTRVAEEPSIDFAGAGRNVPWVSWYEPNSHLSGGTTNIFASRFNATSNVWLPSGADRTGGSLVPSLNIHTNRTAEDPSVAGGAAVAGNSPVPWVTWDERDGATTDAAGKTQIFVSRGFAATTCAGVTPSSGTPVNAFCFQQTGLKRLSATSLTSSATGDPTLNVDPTRSGVEPDMAFTGPNDTVPWVVWYEQNNSGIGLRNNEMVFAAKGVSDTTSGAGGFHWQAVGNGTAGLTEILNRGGAHAFGACATTITSESNCSLNNVATANAEDPRVAAGTLALGSPTVPWVVWAEDIGSGRHAIFISRLVNGDHFQLFNNGQPVSNTQNDATNPDITFSGNEPYVSWQEKVSGVERVFLGHFEGGATTPVFRLDTPTGIVASTFGAVAGQIAPISSSCTADPFTSDGAACPGSAAGTPFFLFTDGAVGHQHLFGRGYKPGAITTKPASGVTSSGATLHATVNPGGSVLLVHFDFGTTTAYGSTTAVTRVGPATTAQSLSATLSGLASGTTFHYRVSVQTDFGTFTGADQTFTTS